MARKNLNRFKKVYPLIRRKPIYQSGGDVTYESGSALVSASDTVTITFTTSFTSAPHVTATAYDSATNGEANVNAYIISVSTASVTIGFSASFTGSVNYHAIQSS